MADHSYEEIREVIVGILGRPAGPDYPGSFTGLRGAVGLYFEQRKPRPAAQGPVIYYSDQSLTQPEAELVRDVFWDLFRQGYITLGSNDSNPGWPNFRLSPFGVKHLASNSADRFHDTSSYITLVRAAAPEVGADAVMYLEEAVAAFYAGCYLAACVMLGVAAEAEFIALAEAAERSPLFPGAFAGIAKERAIKSKIDRFMLSLQPVRSQLQPRKAFENLETNMAAIQGVIRVARNDAGHPSGSSPPSREQVFVFLQLFPAFAKEVAQLRRAMGPIADPSG